VAACFRRLDPENHEAARSAFAKLEQQRIIQGSNSCWAWPLHMVHRVDGSWQPCCDFRQLNLITEPDKFTLPRMDEPGWPPQGMQHLYEAGLEAGLSSDPHGGHDFIMKLFKSKSWLKTIVLLPENLRAHLQLSV
jgi:hypothetical protein